MSLFYNRALPWVLPQVLLLARPESEVAIVSPWMNNLKVLPPRRPGTHPALSAESTYLAELLRYMALEHDIKFLMVVREADDRFSNLVRLLKAAKPSHLKVKIEPDLHAKAIVTESLAITMSANVLYRSLYTNVENCSIIGNNYSTARGWLRDQLSLSV